MNDKSTLQQELALLQQQVAQCNKVMEQLSNVQMLYYRLWRLECERRTALEQGGRRECTDPGPQGQGRATEKLPDTVPVCSMDLGQQQDRALEEVE